MLTRADLEHLAHRVDGGPFVSIYLPTHKGAQGAQDPIRLKNLLAEVERELASLGMSSTNALALLQPARDLLSDSTFWIDQSKGLALFLAGDGMQVFHLPIAVPELAVAQEGFHLKPLLQLIDGDGRFYILAVCLHRIRLFEATRESVKVVPLTGIPLSLLDAVGRDFEQRALHFHTGSGGSPSQGGRRHAMFHGHGAPRDVEKQEIATFLREVDDGIVAVTASSRAPIVLAGVAYITAMYRKMTKCPNVLASSIDGSPEQLTGDRLHELAWPLVAPQFTAGAHEAGARFGALSGTNRTSSDVAEVVQAAFDGRVEALFAPVERSRWGHFDRRTRHLETHERKQPGDQDLIDVAAVQAMMNGGKVFTVPPDMVPGGGEVAAVFRF